MSTSEDQKTTAFHHHGPYTHFPCCRPMIAILFPVLQAGQTFATGGIRLEPGPPSGGCVQCVKAFLHSSHPDILMLPAVVPIPEEDDSLSVEAEIHPPREATTVTVRAFMGEGTLVQMVSTEVRVPAAP